MKTLRTFYLVLVLLALVILAYNYIVVQPKLGDVMTLEGPAQFAAHSEARQMSDMLGIAGICLSGIGMIIALAAYIKSKGIVHLLFAIGAAAVAISTFFVSFGRVA